jgi:hypothetical protein
LNFWNSNWTPQHCAMYDVDTGLVHDLAARHVPAEEVIAGDAAVAHPDAVDPVRKLLGTVAGVGRVRLKVRLADARLALSEPRWKNSGMPFPLTSYSTRALVSNATAGETWP